MIDTNIDCKLPDHAIELEKAEEYIKELQEIFKKRIKNEKINDEMYAILFEKIIRGLEYMGSLSLPLFNIQDQIEETFDITYKHAPELGRKLKWKKIEIIHKPYDILKNRLFKLLDELESLHY